MAWCDSSINDGIREPVNGDLVRRSRGGPRRRGLFAVGGGFIARFEPRT